VYEENPGIPNDGRRPPSQRLPLPRGEEEPGPKGAERGGYSPIPRRDARAGELAIFPV